MTRTPCRTAVRFNKLSVFFRDSHSSTWNYCAASRDHAGKANKYYSCRCRLVSYRPVRVYLWRHHVLLCGRTTLLRFYICTVHPAVIKVFYYQPTHKRIALKRGLKLTLKMLRTFFRCDRRRRRRHIVRSLMTIITPEHAGGIFIFIPCKN